MVRCMDCLHCTHDGLCLIADKWTLIDIEHDCRSFVRKDVEGRTGELEQLCRDMYGQMDYCGGAANHACMRIYRDRMDALGLLEVGE